MPDITTVREPSDHELGEIGRRWAAWLQEQARALVAERPTSSSSPARPGRR